MNPCHVHQNPQIKIPFRQHAKMKQLLLQNIDHGTPSCCDLDPHHFQTCASNLKNNTCHKILSPHFKFTKCEATLHKQKSEHSAKIPHKMEQKILFKWRSSNRSIDFLCAATTAKSTTTLSSDTDKQDKKHPTTTNAPNVMTPLPPPQCHNDNNKKKRVACS